MKSLQYGIICAIQLEAQPYFDSLKHAHTTSHAMLDFVHGKLNSHDVVIVCSGIGKTNAALTTQCLIDTFKVDRIIFSGVAGAINKNLKIGDTVIVNESLYHDLESWALTAYPPYLKSPVFSSDADMLKEIYQAILSAHFDQYVCFGKTVTGDKFALKDTMEQLQNECSPLCVDMETAAAAHVCFANSLPFIAVRSISDTAEHDGMATFEQNSTLAAISSYTVVQCLLS